MDFQTLINVGLLLFIVVGLLFARYVERINQEPQKKPCLNKAQVVEQD